MSLPEISIPEARGIEVDTTGAQIVQEESPAVSNDGCCDATALGMLTRHRRVIRGASTSLTTSSLSHTLPLT
jgi:hypothetical protein